MSTYDNNNSETGIPSAVLIVPKYLNLELDLDPLTNCTSRKAICVVTVSRTGAVCFHFALLEMI